MTSPLDDSDFLVGPFAAEPHAAAETPERPAPPPPPPPPPPHGFPAAWLLEHAAAPVRYRVLTEVVKLPGATPPPFLAALPYTFASAHRLMLAQKPDGTWGDAILATPKAGSRGEFAGVGTLAACHRLLEYGWDRESPPLTVARRLLFRLLAEDDDVAYTFELSKDGLEPETVLRSRGILRQAAAAVLAQAGYEGDPRLRGAANRMLDRVRDYLVSPLAENPWIKVGGKPVLAAEAILPSYHTLAMLAFMPHYRNEHHEVVDRLLDHLVRPMPKYEAVQIVGGRSLLHPYLVLGDPLASKGVPDNDIPFALWWLEIMARLGILRRHDGWSRTFERLLDDRDHEQVWRPRRASNMISTHPMVWPSFPLQPPGPDAASVDVTFRLGLIARLSGRTIELV